MRPPEKAPHRLLVEGPDDKWSVINLMMRHNIDWESWTEQDPKLPHVYDCGGIDPLLNLVNTSAKSQPCLGILIDTNDNPANRWQQIKYRLSNTGISLPDNPEPDGFIAPGFNPNWKVGVWIMPDNSLAGKLEDFLVTLVPSGDSCWSYADEATEKAKNLGAGFSDNDHIKARIHTWLAWQEEPGKPFGTAITAAYFNHDSPVALKFVAWFKKLFLE